MLSRYTCQHLTLNPLVGLAHTVLQANGRLPSQIIQDLCVVAVAAIDSFGSIEFVLALELYAGNLFHDVDKLVDRDEFAAAEVDRLTDVTLKNGLRAFRAVIDVHEA